MNRIKYILTGVVGFLIFIYFVVKTDPNNTEEENIEEYQSEIMGGTFEEQKNSYNKTLELRSKYIGFIFQQPQSTDFINKYGSAETLDGTDNDYWVAYFPEGNLTIVMDKKTSSIENVCDGKISKLNNDVTAALSELVGKRLMYSKYVEVINSIRFGSTERLGIKNCVNADCTEYYPKGNFTTVAFMEFNDEGDFVTLKKISMGKVDRLAEF